MRVQRILKQPQKKSRLGEKLIAALFILATFGLFAFQQKEAPTMELITIEKGKTDVDWTARVIEESEDNVEEEEEVKPLKVKVISAQVDTIPEGLPTAPNGRVRIKTNVNGKKMMIETKNGKIEELKVNNRVINPKDYVKYEKEIAQLLEDAENIPTPPSPPNISDIPSPPPAPPAPPAVRDIPNPPTPPTPPSELREIKVMDENGTTYLREESRKEMKKRIERERKKHAADLEKKVKEYKKEKISQREEARKKAEKRRQEMERERIRARALSSTSQEWRAEQKKRIAKMEEDALLQREDLEALAEHRKEIIEQRKAMLLQAAESQRQVIHAEKANDRTARIEEELKKDGLYNKGIYKFKLANKELKINGKKQSREMYKKYKEICEEEYEGVGVDYSFEIRRTKNGNKQSISIGEFKEQ